MSNQVLLTSISLDELKAVISESVSIELQKFKPIETKSKDQDLITESELSEKLHRSKVTLFEWRKQGLLPFYRIARKIYYNWNEVLEALKKVERRAI